MPSVILRVQSTKQDQAGPDSAVIPQKAEAQTEYTQALQCSPV